MKNIIVTLLVLLFASMAIPVNGQNTEKTVNEKAVHIVLFRFKQGTTTEQIDSLKNEILKQQNIIPGLLEIFFGEDFTGRSKRFYSCRASCF